MSNYDPPAFRIPAGFGPLPSGAAPEGRARSDGPWSETQSLGGRTELSDPVTQIVADRDAYLGGARNDVGRRIADDQVELFVAGDAAASLQREFEQHSPEFLAVHDLGTSASLRLLGSLAGAASARVQRLMIRRQGHGVALSVLQFVEVPLADGTLVRVYSTDLNADPTTRQALARTLLAFSRLGVLLVGERSGAATVAGLAPLREGIVRGPWPNRELLLVPLGAGSPALAAQGNQLSAGSSVTVHVSPPATKPRQIWSFVGGTWNRLHGRPGGERSLETDIARAVPRAGVPRSEALTMPMELQMPPPPSQAGPPTATLPAASPPASLPPFSLAFSAIAPRPMPQPGATPWQAYADRCAQIKGSVACCVFDLHSLRVLAAAAGPPPAERLSAQGAALLAAAADAARALGLGSGHPEVTLSLGAHHLLLRAVPGHPGVGLHLVLAAGTGNPTLARMQLERIDLPH
ncbi:MAG: hypothetical protein ACK5UM_01860 [Pseudomonadota bacterium]|jgi:hypothetical protein|nr:hypothetical protein [Rubrivivax sp.]MCA3257578.1 hypothetical protein [Rubrivivax sp.]MCE2912957.1 hypothetical protein [Rubrivivax sp.]MCZ8029954.1 hypothetical protein [Rubrivivax sp.]